MKNFEDTSLDIKKSLIADINSLRAPGGHLRAGMPNYNHLFGRDACVAALQLLDSDPQIAKNTLQTLAEYQAKRRGFRNEAFPGKILHEHFPGGWKQKIQSLIQDTDKWRKIYILLFWKFPYYGSVDAGAWFIILLHRYYKKTGDKETLVELWPAAILVLNWLKKRAANRPSELVASRRSYFLGLRSQSWKDTIDAEVKSPKALIEVQGYYFQAYNCLAELAENVFDDSVNAEKYRQMAQRLRQSVNEYFWQKNKGYFLMAVNDANQVDETVASNPGHLLFTGILNSEQTKCVMSRLKQSDFVTPYGIRTLSTREKKFDASSYHQGSVWPYDNWVIYQGLLKNGFLDEAEEIKNSLFEVWKKFGNIPELYIVSEAQNELMRYSGACEIQAWSAGALINMLESEKSVL